MSESNRVAARYKVDAYADINAPNDVLLYHSIQNLSVGGICIATPLVREVGALVDVAINFPELNRQIEIKGQIAWANRTPPQDIGIRWVNLAADARLLLESYIEKVAAKKMNQQVFANHKAKDDERVSTL